ncbi:MAG: HD domain-containing protein [Clostridium sp.]|nr:HD domain-containing protein [Clostridium sp.]
MQIFNRKADAELTEFYEIMRILYLSKAEADILEALRRKSEETYWHCVKVARLALTLGISCGLPSEELEPLSIGGLLHDVGKLKIAPEILNKNGKLNEGELQEMRRHSEYGEELLRDKAGETNRTVLDIVRHHHEKVGGTGYPDGIWERHLPVQIVAVADIYDALTSNRCYRKAWDDGKALTLLYEDEGLERRLVKKLQGLVNNRAIYGKVLLKSS